MQGVPFMDKKPELLAPAGDLERLDAAIRFGADAVYLGGPMLQLRADTAGFTMAEVAEAAARAHRAGRKIYVTVNSFVKNGEIALLSDYARALYDAGADAAIVSDLGAICTMKAAVPELEIHVSTQANCLNYAAARHYYDMGAKRVVLGREATLTEIAELRAKTPKELELEAFIHGAMCMSYSGRCLLSAFMNGRSGNRGDCSQPCRYRYAIAAEGDEGDWYPVFEDSQGTTLLSSRDLNTIDFIEDIIAAGVTSLKIEGRMKSTYYVATVVNAYRRRLDGTAPKELCRAELDCASHREYTTGFYFGEARTAPAASAGYTQDAAFIAAVLGEEDGRYVIEQRNNFRAGDRLELLSPNSMGESFVIGDMKDENGEAVTYAPHPKQKLWIKSPVKLAAGDILRRRTEKL